MPNFARAHFNKTMKRCPYCKNTDPKELVEGEKRAHWGMFSLLLFFTAGLGLLYVPLWYRPDLEAYCRECQETFRV